MQDPLVRTPHMLALKPLTANMPHCPAEQYLSDPDPDPDIDAFAKQIKGTTETLQTVVIMLTRPDTFMTLGADVEYK